MKRAEEIKPLQKLMEENPEIHSLAEARKFLLEKEKEKSTRK